MVLEVLCESRKCGEVNCDSCLVVNNDDFFLGAVADGVGNYSEVASQTALELVKSFCDKSIDEIMRLTVSKFQSLKLEEDTTLVASIIRNDKLFLRYVGDSYAFLIRDNRIYQLCEEQNARNFLENFFGKHPREVTLDDLMGLINDRPEQTGYLVGSLIGVGGDVYNIFRDNSVGAECLGLSEEMNFIKTYFKDGFDEDEFDKLNRSDKRRLIIAFINLIHRLWRSPCVMDNAYWSSMYSTLNDGVVQGFSREVVHLMNSEGCIDLVRNDVVVLATDGVIRNIGLRFFNGYDLVKNWDYRNVVRDKVKSELKELVKNFDYCKRAIAPPITNGDDATIIVVKYN